jgi:hypothetical protein
MADAHVITVCCSLGLQIPKTASKSNKPLVQNFILCAGYKTAKVDSSSGVIM